MIKCTRISIAALVVLALLLVALVATSCGGRTTTQQGAGTQGVNTGNPTIDNAIEKLDGQMDSVSSDDFNDSQLNDSELGL
ncbi:MAG: hypothetical protein KKF41_14255 [Actinobacteria bacterium]|nr:hypothetical protein [Actinomycetota bacterium]MBU1942588.1 hypothetical protein [Actinomycetota bacterium]MBU2688736.1 hypothetical protein [Actinomycetota bacterium]